MEQRENLPIPNGKRHPSNLAARILAPILHLCIVLPPSQLQHPSRQLARRDNGADTRRKGQCIADAHDRRLMVIHRRRHRRSHRRRHRRIKHDNRHRAQLEPEFSIEVRVQDGQQRTVTSQNRDEGLAHKVVIFVGLVGRGERDAQHGAAAGEEDAEEEPEDRGVEELVHVEAKTC